MIRIFKDRINEVTNAIKLVFASIFFQESKSHFSHTAHRTEEEKMAVILMEIAGKNIAVEDSIPHLAAY